MSLDVYLRIENTKTENGSGIFIRENGQVKEISLAEWDKKFPNTEPVYVISDDIDNEVYWRNITHNLNKMADEAGIYDCMWQPRENGLDYAYQLIELLQTGLEKLKENPMYYKQFNPPNGWGDYDGFVEFVEDYLRACKKYPTASVYTSR